MMPTMSVKLIKGLRLGSLDHIIKNSSERAKPVLESMVAAARLEMEKLPEIEEFPHYLAYLYLVKGLSLRDIVRFFEDRNVSFRISNPPSYISDLMRIIGITPKEQDYKESKGQSLSSYPITPAEANILYCAAHGYNLIETASLLGISLQTIKNHRNSMFSSLGVFDITQAVVVAYETGWLSDDGFQDYTALSGHRVTARVIDYHPVLRSALERFASESQINE